tara:strand:- start:832 stop:2079 length:1248 start_codon:yes stop_codon:yes gene_type:complete
MKKKTIIVGLLILIFAFAGSFSFIKKARENRSWPFNSSLGNYLPKSVKYFAYKFTNPDENIIETHFYDLKVDYYSIPSSNSVGNGGGIDIFEKNKMLVLLDNGEIFFFDTKKNDFDKTNNLKLKENYASIRDINYENKELLILGVKDLNDNCSAIILDKYFKIVSNGQIDFEHNNTIWMSEKYCDDILVNNAGGRIVKFDNKIYISTGYFTPYVFSGINYFPQDSKSSFGKIIQIDNDGISSIFSKGHRNPQGLFIYNNEFILSSEHGPRGGDELNLIKKNNNYGWPCETAGSLYSYENTGLKKEIWLSKEKLKEYGCESNKKYIKPIYTWTPSIAASQGIHYRGDYFDIFKDNIILGSLGGLSLLRMILDDEKIINIERIKINERIRDISESYEGKIILYTDGGSLIILSKVNN